MFRYLLVIKYFTWLLLLPVIRSCNLSLCLFNPPPTVQRRVANSNWIYCNSCCRWGKSIFFHHLHDLHPTNKDNIYIVQCFLHPAVVFWNLFLPFCQTQAESVFSATSGGLNVNCSSHPALKVKALSCFLFQRGGVTGSWLGLAPSVAWSVVDDDWGVNWSGLNFFYSQRSFFLVCHVDVQDQVVNIAPLDHLLHLHLIIPAEHHCTVASPAYRRQAWGGGASARGAGNSGNVIYNECGLRSFLLK